MSDMHDRRIHDVYAQGLRYLQTVYGDTWYAHIETPFMRFIADRTAQGDTEKRTYAEWITLFQQSIQEAATMINDLSGYGRLIGEVYDAWQADQITEDAVPRALMVRLGDLTEQELHAMARQLQRLSTQIRSIIDMRKADVDDER